jgi:dephospho-CoA kinase
MSIGLFSWLLGFFPNGLLPECHYLFQVDLALSDLKILAMSELVLGIVAAIPFSFLISLATKRFVLILARRFGLILASAVLSFLVGDFLLDLFVPSLDCLSSGRGMDEQNQALCVVVVIRVLCVYVGTYLGQSFVPVALTGSIATGKSTVAKMMLENESLPFIIIDTDQIGHEILIPPNIIEENSQNYSISPSDSVFIEILEAFGDKSVENKNILDDDNRIDRRKLGAIIFHEPAQRRRLNRITHPRIILSMIKQMVHHLYFGQSKFVCADVPLLFESGKLRWLFATTIVVLCNPDLQLERLRKRNPDLNEQQCRERIASQIPVNRKAELSDTVIWNNGGIEDLQKQVVSTIGDLEKSLYWATRISLSRYVLAAGGLALGSLIFNGSLSDAQSLQT